MTELYRICEHVAVPGPRIVVAPMHKGNSHLILCVECANSPTGAKVYEVGKKIWLALREEINNAPDVKIN